MGLRPPLDKSEYNVKNINNGARINSLSLQFESSCCCRLLWSLTLQNSREQLRVVGVGSFILLLILHPD